MGNKFRSLNVGAFSPEILLHELSEDVHDEVPVWVREALLDHELVDTLAERFLLLRRQLVEHTLGLCMSS